MFIEIAIDDPAWGGEPALRAIVATAAAAVFARLGLAGRPRELSVLFTGDDRIAELNARWRGKPGPTNVLSFPAAQLAPGAAPGLLLGDIALARPTVAREAAIEAKAFDAHLTHLIVHGILHLLGYDHAEDDAAEQMEQLERAILADLGVDDPYAPISDT